MSIAGLKKHLKQDHPKYWTHWHEWRGFWQDNHDQIHNHTGRHRKSWKEYKEEGKLHSHTGQQ